MMRQVRPKTSSISAAVTTVADGPSATLDPSFITTRVVA